jgi:DNA-binding GntR family transcriptional regulator
LGKRLTAGTALRQVEIAKRLSTSRTPVREAVLRLAGDGLVQLSPRRGASVSFLSVRDFVEINELRWLLEGFAARRAAAAMPTEEIENLSTDLASLFDGTDLRSREGNDTLAAFDERIHLAVAANSGNDRLRDEIESLYRLMTISRLSDVEQRPEDMHASLHSVVEALRSRDSRLAENRMRDHIGQFAVQFSLRDTESAAAVPRDLSGMTLGPD